MQNISVFSPSTTQDQCIVSRPIARLSGHGIVISVGEQYSIQLGIMMQLHLYDIHGYTTIVRVFIWR